MAALTLAITLDGAAIEDGGGVEVATMLRKVARKLDEDGLSTSGPNKILDSNGNAVGSWSIGGKR